MNYAHQRPYSMSTQFAKYNHSLTGPAMRAFSQIARAWSLTELEQTALLGQPGSVTNSISESEGGADLPRETLVRISYLLGIYHALHTIFPDRRQADGWIRRPNAAPPFQGASALALMCSGRLADLAVVRQHLEAGGLTPPLADQ